MKFGFRELIRLDSVQEARKIRGRVSIYSGIIEILNQFQIEPNQNLIESIRFVMANCTQTY